MATKLLPLLLLATPSLAQTVTITRDIPSSGHECVRDCLHRPYAAGTDLGDALECGPPYEEDCYCPTAAPQASVVSRHINDCASESCSRGDLTKDIESMRYYYAGYCVENGYTAELVEAWYASAEIAETSAVTSEGETTVTSTSVVSTTTATEEEDEETSSTSTTEASTSEETEQAATSTRTSVVTETAGGEEEDDGRNPDGLPEMDFEGDDSGDAEDGASLSRAIVDVTSTAWVNSQGSRVASPPDDSDGDDSSGVNVIALGVGLGVGVPLVIVGVSVGIWLCLRQRKRQEAQATNPPSPESQQPSPENQSPAQPSVVLPVVQSEKQELHGYHVPREIYGTEVHPFPSNSPSPPVVVAGRYEMSGGSRPQEMDASRYR